MKKTITAVLAFALLLVFAPIFTAALPVSSELTVSSLSQNSGPDSPSPTQLSNVGITFSDVSESHWAYNDIQALVELGALNGYLDGTFKPGRDLTRGEMAKVISEVFDVVNPTGWTFPDFDSEHDEFHETIDDRSAWYAPHAQDIYFYYSTGHDGPNEFGGAYPAVRRDVVNVLVNVIYRKYSNGEWSFEYDVPDDYMDYLEETFTDIASFLAGDYESLPSDFWWSPYENYGHWYIASKIGIISGYPDGSFRHYGNITRAEFCVMVNRALALLY